MAQGTAAEEGLQHLANLEKKILRTVEQLHAARAEKEEWAREKNHVRRKLVEQDQLLRSLQERVARLEKERDGIKTRVHRMLEQVDSLAQAGLDGE
ncbi:MAG TPA: hypothetical protein VIC04_01440 [Terriglobia bacterium]